MTVGRMTITVAAARWKTNCVWGRRFMPAVRDCCRVVGDYTGNRWSVGERLVVGGAVGEKRDALPAGSPLNLGWESGLGE